MGGTGEAAIWGRSIEGSLSFPPELSKFAIFLLLGLLSFLEGHLPSNPVPQTAIQKVRFLGHPVLCNL